MVKIDISTNVHMINFTLVTIAMDIVIVAIL